MTIQEVKQLLAQTTIAPEVLQTLTTDSRLGVQKLLQSYQKRQAKLAAKQAAFNKRFEFEQAFWKKGQLVAGVDEVGRGPLAGPVVAAAVVIDRDFDLWDVNDSKQLSAKRRLELYPQILQAAVAVGIGMKDAAVIDQINIYQADRQAMHQAVLALNIRPDSLLVDAMDVPVELPQVKLIKGDARSNSIAAASIVAKVFRDTLMDDYAKRYPQYHFTHNAGYGTKEHLQALEKYGPCPIHRRTFAPVSNFN
ncbi:MAG: ribonuclease HII [Lactobacillus sp.]